MSDETDTLEDAVENPVSHDDIYRELRQGMNAVAFQRLIEDEARLNAQIEKHYEAAREKQRGQHPPKNTLIEEINTSIIANLQKDNPDYFKQAENNASADNLGDILSLLTPVEGDPKWDGYTDAEKDAILDLRDDKDVQDILRQQRYIEDQLGTPEGMPSLNERVKEWIESGDAKAAATHAKYAVMAGMIVAAPPMAATMLASMAVRKVALPHAMKAGEKLYGMTEQYLVDKGILSQEKVDQNKERLDNATQTITDSKWGRFGMALGAIALTGVATSLAMDGLSGDDLGTRMQNLWSSAKGLAGDTPGVGPVDMPDAPEISDEAIESAEHVASGEPFGTDALTHSDGGVSRDALAERFDDAGHSDIGDYLRGLDSEQLTANDVSDMAERINPSAGDLTPEELTTAARDELGVDLSGLSQAAETPLNTPDVTPTELSGDAGAPEASAPESGVAGDVTHVTHDVVVGDTLSEAIYDAYQAEGVQISAGDLYGPSEYTDHPGGIVGMVAEGNGFSDPDLIYPGDSIAIDVQLDPSVSLDAQQEVSDVAREAAEKVAEPDPTISAEALEAANGVASGADEPTISEAAEKAASEVVSPAGADEQSPEATGWLLSLTGAFKRFFGSKDEDLDGTLVDNDHALPQTLAGIEADPVAESGTPDMNSTSMDMNSTSMDINDTVMLGGLYTSSVPSDDPEALAGQKKQGMASEYSAPEGASTVMHRSVIESEEGGLLFEAEYYGLDERDEGHHEQGPGMTPGL